MALSNVISIYSVLKSIFFVFLSLFITFSQNARAEQHGHHGPHHISVLLAGTEIDGHDTAPTIGLDYEYRVNKLLGLGLVAEYAADDIDATTFLAVADVHLYKGLIMQLGPGVEFGEHEHFVARMGMLYEWEFDAFTVSPQLHFDYMDGAENAVVFGIAIGKNF